MSVALPQRGRRRNFFLKMRVLERNVTEGPRNRKFRMIVTLVKISTKALKNILNGDLYAISGSTEPIKKQFKVMVMVLTL